MHKMNFKIPYHEFYKKSDFIRSASFLKFVILIDSLSNFMEFVLLRIECLNFVEKYKVPVTLQTSFLFELFIL